MTSKQTHNRTREDAKHFAPFLFAHIPKGKRKQQAHKNKQNKQEDKPRTTKAKPKKIGEEDEKRKK